MTPTLRVLGLIVALAATVAITQASVLRMRLNPSDAAVLRLAWTARPERVEDCRSQTEEELSKLPAHMRQAVVCEGTTASYRLEVRYQGDVIAEQLVRGGGLRRDRPLYVSRDIQLPPGDAHISVRFVRVDAQTSPRPSGKDHPERHYSREETVPPLLSLERRLHLASRQVILVTYDPERREFAVLEKLPH